MIGRAKGHASGGPASPAGAGGWPDWASLVLIILILGGLAVLLYAPVLPPEPVLDDGPVALENGAVHSGSPPWTVATYYADGYRPLWRPLATASLRANWLLAVDARPPGRSDVQAAAQAAMIWTHVVLFAALAGLAFLWLRRTGLSLGAGAVAAALLVLHPVNCESVWRLAGRSELLGHFFLLSAFLIYVAHLSPPVGRGDQPRPTRGRHALAWVGFGSCALASLLARETALLLPVFLIGYELTLGGAWRWGPRDGSAVKGSGAGCRRSLLIGLAICVVLGALWAGVRAGVLAGLPAAFRLAPVLDFTQALDPDERIRLALALPWLYLRILFLAGPLLPDYTHLIARPADAPDVILGDPGTFGVRSPSGGEVLPGVLVIVLWVGLVLLLRRREPRAALGAWIFGTSLLAVLPLLEPNGAVASLRHLFLPLLGLLLMLGGLVERLACRLWARARAVWVQGCLVGGLGVVILALAWSLGHEARAYTLQWTDPANYLSRLRAAAPDSPVPGFILGSLAISQGQNERAAEFYEETIGFFPRNPVALLNLGLIRAQQRQYGVAGRILHDAIIVAGRVYPGSRLHSNSHLAMATLFGCQNLEEAGTTQLHLAVAADSTNVKALGQLGLLLALSYSTAEDGIRLMTRALDLDREIRQRGEPGPLGALAERIGYVRRRAARNLGFPEDQWETDEAAEPGSESEAESGFGSEPESESRSGTPTGSDPRQTPE
ncbi:MAG: hypothetical protein KAY32_11840 [Candidatus Eisenbacteria sp.]|nr:hypothetical protein [Candidatus Eisenbacteria bacterium]